MKLEVHSFQMPVKDEFRNVNGFLTEAVIHDWGDISEVTSYGFIREQTDRQVALLTRELAQYVPHHEPEWVTCTLINPAGVGVSLKIEITKH